MHEASSNEQMCAVVHAIASPRSPLDSTLLMHDIELHMHLIDGAMQLATK
jgi:hypothetical protein